MPSIMHGRGAPRNCYRKCHAPGSAPFCCYLARPLALMAWHLAIPCETHCASHLPLGHHTATSHNPLWNEEAASRLPSRMREGCLVPAAASRKAVPHIRHSRGPFDDLLRDLGEEDVAEDEDGGSAVEAEEDDNGGGVGFSSKFLPLIILQLHIGNNVYFLVWGGCALFL
ncbi:hypothetical protein HAX54_005152 [Datura stramonium]|uniref:Uncharacterized protein n=1 Tax=Datura stramonium TaxID=4076 RepID=A0ABS8TAK8_DATST|nr:hypothetical protein [Datura stramonium]